MLEMEDDDNPFTRLHPRPVIMVRRELDLKWLVRGRPQLPPLLRPFVPCLCCCVWSDFAPCSLSLYTTSTPQYTALARAWRTPQPT